MAARADKPGGPYLQVHAGAMMPDGTTWMTLTPALLAGSSVVHAGDLIAVGPSATLSLLDITIPGGRANCPWRGERDIEFRFRAWSTNPADSYTSSDWYESTEINAYGIHDVPGTDVDQHVYLSYDAVCL